ncbi:condensation domain-containing protein [Chryseobacterium potabilaquae]|uniref:Surfactin synthase subunit 2 n=1 Tax=Chryseobacterium potabilaquae TaxID=2675057 RepID=A0A6N4XBG4_9FLAO|nr:condensation domain-containing protein [Chryseobacterium potabilaquae]CAA7196346.1 Surfactin synthase subunit 2 [Chryseobacterium potabilaquae]
MQNINDFYNELTNLNISINLFDDNLEVFYEQDTENINEYLILIKENKAQLVDFLTKRKKNLNEIPLSPAQRNILFKCLQGGSSSYNMSQIFKVDKSFSDIEKIKENFNYITNKHEALKMKLSNKNGKYFFIVDNNSSQVDIFDNVEHSLVTDYVYSTFDLEKNLVKLGIFKNENEIFLCLVLHHIIGDDKSLSIIQKDFLDFINGVSVDHNLVEHFTDYLTYLQNERETINRSKGFWVEKMSNIKRNQSNSFNILHKSETPISKNGYFSFKLNNKIQRNLFPRLIASLSFTIKNLFNKHYVIFTVPFSTRDILSHHQQVGYYINQLPLGIDSDSHRIEELIMNVRNEIFEYNDHKLYPFSSIMSGIGISHELFNISVVLLNEISENIADNRFEAVKSEVIQNVSLKNDIAFEFLYDENETTLTLHVEYNDNFIETNNMEKLINKAYEYLLETE